VALRLLAAAIAAVVATFAAVFAACSAQCATSVACPVDVTVAATARIASSVCFAIVVSIAFTRTATIANAAFAATTPTIIITGGSVVDGVDGGCGSGGCGIIITGNAATSTATAAAATTTTAATVDTLSDTAAPTIATTACCALSTVAIFSAGPSSPITAKLLILAVSVLNASDDRRRLRPSTGASRATCNAACDALPWRNVPPVGLHAVRLDAYAPPLGSDSFQSEGSVASTPVHPKLWTPAIRGH